MVPQPPTPVTPSLVRVLAPAHIERMVAHQDAGDPEHRGERAREAIGSCPARAAAILLGVLLGEDQVGHLCWPVDLDEVSGVGQQVQFAVRKQGGELPGDPRVEGPVPRAEDHPDRGLEPA